MAKMTRGEIRVELQHRGFDGFLEDDLNRYINWGYFDLARRLRVKSLEATVTWNTVSGEYRKPLSSLSPSPKSIEAVVMTDPDAMELTPLKDRDFWLTWAPLGYAQAGLTIDSPSSPSQYFVWDEALIITPAADGVYSLVIKTMQEVVELTDDGDSPLFPLSYEEVLMDCVIRFCHVRANEFDEASTLQTTINNRIAEILNENAFTTTELQDRVEPDDAWPNRWY